MEAEKKTTQKATEKKEEKSGYDFDNFEQDKLTRPRDEAWDNFVSWKDAKEGDKVQGYIRDAFYRPAEYKSDGTIAFKDQRGITLEGLDGKLMNVTVKYLDFILKATDNLRVGDPLTIVWESTMQPREKGYAGAKVFKYYGTNLPENANQPTVKELCDEDRLAGGTSTEEEPEEVETEEVDDKELPEGAF